MQVEDTGRPGPSLPHGLLPRSPSARLSARPFLLAAQLPSTPRTAPRASYRLCPASEPLTEACFQKTPLAFASASQWLRWNNGTVTEFPAVRVNEGTTPEGSEWSR